MKKRLVVSAAAIHIQPLREGEKNKSRVIGTEEEFE